MTRSLFIFGYGYTAAYLARELVSEGWRVGVTTRQPQKRTELCRLGITAYDFPDAEIPNVLQNFEHLLVSIAPGKQGDVVLNQYRDVIFRHRWRWIGYLSTTGVYGDHAGGWVNEETPVQPLNPRLQRRIEAESSWLRLREDMDHPVHIFRLAGIYGPGRSAFTKLREGKAQRIDKEGQVFSRIHVGDITQALRASIRQPCPGRIYNLSDNEPAPASDVIAFAAKLAGIPMPPLISFEAAALSEMAQEFYSASRRVSNERLKYELGINLAYPTYREGLRHCLDSECASSERRLGEDNEH